MKRISLITFILFTVNASLVHSQPKLKTFNSAIKDLILRYFPNSTFTMTDTTLIFESNAREFYIHSANKIGSWEDAIKVRGPNRGGIYCEIYLRRGKPEPTAAEKLYLQGQLPRFDQFYFYESVLTPLSEKYNCYISVDIRYSKEISEQFLSEFELLANNFESYL